jgi:CBS domain-containing protein
MSEAAVASDTVFRAKLGGRLVMAASLGVIVLGIIVIAAAALGAKDSPVKEAAQLIFTSVLPLLGTWVGTVLAFYYTRENFESASRTTLAAVRSGAQQLASTRVTDKMMPADQIIKAEIPAGKGIGDLSLKTISDLFETKLPTGQTISRLLIVKKDGGACIGIIHRSIWMELQLVGAKLTPPMNPASDSLAKILTEKSASGKTFNEIITTTLAYVAADRTLADAKMVMEAAPLCQDVIVTQTGNRDERMLGWISNVDIARLSQA